ncbi:tRNA (adenosine(37)-N6)-dimethylallyltransferase MiaA [Psychrobacter sp. I-STPA6b]|uniref:tRNA (adenosine(37)-N6)-dimethylallyltransferase MiaA n=1 Tax=Psychrobacter sp. I-STPA6b TaxID=2585718 RepID=UPI001D0CCD4B|nr:tRNA (adenosine(37)-N6)-dimethylallyltransferase MiaA [Psychrobacter sp. I-STPA6b]
MNTLYDKNSVVCLMAPTASGKTALAYELYDTGQFELVSVDSALIYRDMNIGTAKPSADELAQYPHHLVDIIDPTQQYSVADFVADVDTLIAQIHRRGKIPLLVGGTMMYYMSLFDGISNIPDSDAGIRAKVEAKRQEEGIHALHDYLTQVDPAMAQRLSVNDTQRITRAVEVYMQTGQPLSVWQQTPKVALANNPEQQWHALIVTPDRAWLHQRIAKRLDIMWQQGLVEEVISLIEQYPLSRQMPSMRCVGYRQVLDYLQNIEHPVMDLLMDATASLSQVCQEKLTTTYKHDRMCTIQKEKMSLSLTKLSPKNNDIPPSVACQDMKNKALYATRQLAKRQFTWLRKFEQLDCFTNTLTQCSKSRIKTFDDVQELKKFMDTSI